MLLLAAAVAKVVPGDDARIPSDGRVAAHLVARNTAEDVAENASLPEDARQALLRHRALGVASCAAAGCHGATEDRIGTAVERHKPRGEYTFWSRYDPHARAYTVLHNELSARIADRLQLSTSPARSKICLSCHSGVDPISQEPAAVLDDGVGCESCHGAAEHWIDAHKEAGWRWRGPGAEPDEFRLRRESLGFRDTRDPLTRARICVECHVGGRDRDVTHDLIAAGHPRMNFEFSAFHARLPKHWHRSQDVARFGPAFELKIWILGQLAAAEAAARLTAIRAENAEAQPWPEFAEYNCYACHHDLVSDSWRRDEWMKSGGDASAGDPLKLPEVAPGAIAWNSWYRPMLPLLAEETGGPAGDVMQQHLQQLQKQLGRLGGRAEIRQQIADEARALADLLQAWANRQNSADESPGNSGLSILQRLLETGEPAARHGWDPAAQHYLGMVPVYQSLVRTGRVPPDAVPEISEALRRMRDGLSFPGEHGLQYESPRSQSGGPSPAAGFDGRGEYIRQIERLRDLHGETGLRQDND